MPEQTNTIRLGERTTRRVRTLWRSFALGTFPYGSPRGSENHSVGLTHEVAMVRPSLMAMTKVKDVKTRI